MSIERALELVKQQEIKTYGAKELLEYYLKRRMKSPAFPNVDIPRIATEIITVLEAPLEELPNIDLFLQTTQAAQKRKIGKRFMTPQEVIEYTLVNKIGTDKNRAIFATELLKGSDIITQAIKAIKEPLEDLPMYMGYRTIINLIVKHRVSLNPEEFREHKKRKKVFKDLIKTLELLKRQKYNTFKAIEFLERHAEKYLNHPYLMSPFLIETYQEIQTTIEAPVEDLPNLEFKSLIPNQIKKERLEKGV